MAETLLFSIAAILVLGIGAQWLAWRIHVPAILLLLVLGFIAGPVTGLVSPDRLFGELLSPMVSLAVALILFEGGLSLRVDELREIGGVVYRLVSIGAAVTWLAIAAAAFYVLDLGTSTSLLLGAVLVVTGPTVVIPLINHVRPKRRLWTILKWEGITIDPIGVLLAVIVFEAVRAGQLAESAPQIAVDIVLVIGIAGIGGVVTAAILVFAIRYHWIPDELINPAVITLMFAAVAASNALQPESGLATATVIGAVLGNQNRISIRRIAEFQANIQVLVLSGLFILLAARIPVDLLESVSWRLVAFVAILIFAVRPMAVLISTVRSKLDWRERGFLAWMAPRGIVAAAISSVFAVSLAEAGIGEPERLISITFIVIVVTVVVYGFTATPVAKLLGIQRPPGDGFLVLGAQPWARDIARLLQDLGTTTILVDDDRTAIREARLEGFRAVYTSPLSKYASQQLDLAGLGIGNLLAFSGSDDRNALASLHYSNVFGRACVYQLTPEEYGTRREGVSLEYRGRLLFNDTMTYESITERYAQGARIVMTKLTREFDYDAWLGVHDNKATPLFVVTERASGQSRVQVCTVDGRNYPQAGQTVIGLVGP